MVEITRAESRFLCHVATVFQTLQYLRTEILNTKRSLLSQNDNKVGLHNVSLQLTT